MNSTKITAALIIAILAAAFTIMYVAYTRGQAPAAPAPDEEASMQREARRVDDTSWHYTVDPVAEQKFAMQVAPPPAPMTGELMISGKGCNSMSAVVSVHDPRSDDQPAETREIDGVRYALSHSMSTLMACVDERETWDQKVSAEITAIFRSLSK